MVQATVPGAPPPLHHGLETDFFEIRPLRRNAFFAYELVAVSILLTPDVVCRLRGRWVVAHARTLLSPRRSPSFSRGDTGKGVQLLTHRAQASVSIAAALRQ